MASVNRPSAGTKVQKNGDVTFESNVDHAKWKLYQLCKQALYDSGMVIRKKAILELKRLPGMRRNKRAYKGIKFKMKNYEDGMKIGMTHDSWYSARQELGDKGMKKHGILRDTVFNNIDVIKNIQAQYLTEMNNNNSFEAKENEEEND